MGAKVEWAPYSITVTGPAAFGGKLKGIDHDCNDIPDAAMTAAVAALYAEVGGWRLAVGGWVWLARVGSGEGCGMDSPGWSVAWRLSCMHPSSDTCV